MQPQSKNFNTEYGKMDFSFIVLSHVQALGNQILKLPHEMVDKDIGVTGTTHRDILQSYFEGVEHLEALLSPYHTKEYLSEVTKLTEKEGEFYYAKSKFACLMRLCDAKGFLLGKVAGKTPLEGGEDG